jgi:ABC-type amino acid transport substrate-binding protein
VNLNRSISQVPFARHTGIAAVMRGLLRVAVCLVISMQGSVAYAISPMVYIYNAPESPHDVRYVYHWEILKTALERTQHEYGPYRMIPSVPMTERRQINELEQDTRKLTVMYRDPTFEQEQTLTPIRIPVDKNLVGYRIFLIRKGDQGRLREVKTIDDLRRFTIGVGSQWIDVDLLTANKLRVVTGSNYDGLFEMLMHGRFDILSRGASEILDEYEERKKKMPDLLIEDTLLVTYPAPMYFWFSNTPEGKRLAARAEAGMRAMIKDGTYDAIFSKYYRSIIERLNLRKRRLIRIKNPFLGPETPLNDARLWFDPQKYK